MVRQKSRICLIRGWRATVLAILCCSGIRGQTVQPAGPESEKNAQSESCSQWLPKGAEACILKRRPSAVKITDVSLVVFSANSGGPGYDLLGVAVSYQTKVGWESVVHHELVLRKKSDERTWANAEVYFFNPGNRAYNLWKWFDRGWTWDEMRKDLQQVQISRQP